MSTKLSIDTSYLQILIAYRLIALMLRQLKMTVQECLDEYSALMEQVIGSGWLNDYGSKQGRYIATGDFHSAATFKKVTKDLLR